MLFVNYITSKGYLSLGILEENNTFTSIYFDHKDVLLITKQLWTVTIVCVLITVVLLACKIVEGKYQDTLSQKTA